MKEDLAYTVLLEVVRVFKHRLFKTIHYRLSAGIISGGYIELYDTVENLSINASSVNNITIDILLYYFFSISMLRLTFGWFS